MGASSRGTRYYPSGHVRVQDNTIGTNVPVVNTLVKARRWFKVSTTYTNTSAYFRIGTGFRKKATVLVKFKNQHATVRGINGKLKVWQYIWPVKYDAGTFSRTGMQNLNITFNRSTDPHSNTSRYWAAATAINAVHQARLQNQQLGLPQPLSNLNIWLSSKITKGGSAPMLRRIASSSVVYNGIQAMLGDWGSAIMEVVKQAAPDVTYRYGRTTTQTRNYDEVSSTMLHEMAHVTHYGRAGNGFWTSYIGHILSKGGYGQRTDGTVGYAAVGEAWANFLESNQVIRYYNGFGTNQTAQRIIDNNQRDLEHNIPDNTISISRLATNAFGNDIGSRGWIPFGMLHDMTDVGETVPGVVDGVDGYTIPQIFQGFTATATNIPTLTNNILTSNGNHQAVQVNTLRQSYGW